MMTDRPIQCLECRPMTGSFKAVASDYFWERVESDPVASLLPLEGQDVDALISDFADRIETAVQDAWVEFVKEQKAGVQA